MSTVPVETRIRFSRENDGKVLFRGQYAVVTEAATLDMSVLGRDITNLFATLVDWPQRAVYLIGQRLRILVVHLLKWRYQPERRIEGHSWENTINTQRNDIDDLLHDSPSLRPQVQERLTQQYGKARRQALRETRLAESAVPESCPWTVAQVLDDDFWPDAG